MKHISDVSCYNHNYFVGLQRLGKCVPDLLFAKSDDDTITLWYYIDGSGVPIEFG